MVAITENTMTTVENVILDFTNGAEHMRNQQPKAIMTASLAKRLLKLYAEKLINVSLSQIIENQVAELRKCSTIEQVVETSLDFVSERELIDNVTNNNWDAYKLEVI